MPSNWVQCAGMAFMGLPCAGQIELAALSNRAPLGQCVYTYIYIVLAKLIRSHFNGWNVFKFHAVLVWARLSRQVALILDFAANARRMSNTKNVYPPPAFPLCRPLGAFPL